MSWPTSPIAAGAAIMRDLRAPVTAEQKADGSPLTAADLAAEEVIVAGLARAFPGVPVISEEAALTAEGLGASGTFMLVDPLDGTKEFISRQRRIHGEHRRHRRQPPARRRGLCAGAGPALARRARRRRGDAGGAAQRHAAWRGRRRAGHRRAQAARRATSSRSPAGPIAMPRPRASSTGCRSADRRSVGSSLKFCLVAEGQADVYPRFGPTMEWDTARRPGRAGGRRRARHPARHDDSAAYGKAGAGWRNGAFIAWGG